MDDFFKYLTASEEDKDWGLHLNVAGKSCIASNTSYPPTEHPSGYFFSWKSGRILQEYQINYITEGSGIMETEDGRYPVREGSLLIIPIEKWHRYRPNKKKWVDRKLHWILRAFS